MPTLTPDVTGSVYLYINSLSAGNTAYLGNSKFSYRFEFSSYVSNLPCSFQSGHLLSPLCFVSVLCSLVYCSRKLCF